MTNSDIFKAWLAEMEWDGHGGIKAAAAALGCSRRRIEMILSGDGKLSTEMRLAMTALAQGLRPWDPDSEGLPGVHVALSIGRG